jgi:hypothetical protein
MKRAALLLVIVLSAQADQVSSTQARWCKDIGEYIASLVRQRDTGVPKGEVLKQVGEKNTLWRKLVFSIYDNPNYTAQTARDEQLKCLLQVGGPP